MFSFQKKKIETSDSGSAQAWHPNFRNFKQLPDTKTVRTAFFVNGVAVVLASVLLLWFAYQEYQLRELRREIASWQAQIDRDRPASEQAVTQFKKFQAQAMRVEEINTFVASKPAVSELLIQLGQSLPSFIAIDGFELRATGLRLVASVRGAPDAASGHASTYLEQLRRNPGLAVWFDDAALLNVNRNPQTGRLVVEYFLKFKAGAPGKAGKK